MPELLELGGERVLRYAADDPVLDGEQRASDLVGDALSSRATMIAVPVDRLGADFFQLRSGLAGAIVQKVVVYHLNLAVVGDVSAHLEASEALRDWVRECNRGDDVCFVPSFDDLAARLADAAPLPPAGPGPADSSVDG